MNVKPVSHPPGERIHSWNTITAAQRRYEKRGESIRRIAQKLGVPPGTVKTWIRRYRWKRDEPEWIDDEIRALRLNETLRANPSLVKAAEDRSREFKAVLSLVLKLTADERRLISGWGMSGLLEPKTLGIQDAIAALQQEV